MDPFFPGDGFQLQTTPGHSGLKEKPPNGKLIENNKSQTRRKQGIPPAGFQSTARTSNIEHRTSNIEHRSIVTAEKREQSRGASKDGEDKVESRTRIAADHRKHVKAKSAEVHMEEYFGAYHIFQVQSKDEAAQLMSADNLVGDLYEIQIELNEGEHRAWLVNRFNQKTGFFDPCFSRKLSILRANGLTLRASLSLVGYTEEPSESTSDSEENKSNQMGKDPADKNRESGYWGEAAVFGFKEAYRESFDPFVQNVSKKLKEGVRPRINLGDEGFKQVVGSKGAWIPDQKEPRPQQQRGTVIMKDHLTLSDKMIEQGRQGNKGCYLISWAFIAGIILLVILFVRSFL